MPFKQHIKQMHRNTLIILVLTFVVCAAIVLSPAFSESANRCSSCHPSYYQYLDLLEGDSRNNLPSTIAVNQTLTVSVILENRANTIIDTTLSSVSVTLASKNGYFSVATPTYNIGTLQRGTATATWQITGLSEGSDELVITANARNPHEQLYLSDSYSPSKKITVQSSQPPPTNFTVTIQSSPNGTTIPASGTYTYPSGTPVTFTATPNLGNKFDQWMVNGNANTTNPMTLTVESSLTLLPVFGQVDPSSPLESFTVTLKPSVNGTTTPTSGIYSYNTGDNLTITATPNNGYEFDHWLINNIENNTNPITLTIASNSTIEPVFSRTISPINLIITLSSPTNGEKWQADTTHNIEWATSGSTGTLIVTLEYSDSADSQTWTTIATNLQNNGSISWKVPKDLTTCYIRANATDNETTLSATALAEVEITPSNSEFPLFVVIIITVPLVGTFLVFLKWKNSRTKTQKLAQQNSYHHKETTTGLSKY